MSESNLVTRLRCEAGRFYPTLVGSGNTLLESGVDTSSGRARRLRARADRRRDLGTQRAEQAALRGDERGVVLAGRLAQHRVAVERRRGCRARQDIPACVLRAMTPY